MDFEIKATIVRKFGTQAQAALAMEIDESKLSRILRGYREPSERELAILRRVLGLSAKQVRAARDRAKKLATP